MNMFVTVDSNWGIGSGGELLVHIPRDQRFLRDETQGKVVVIGRKSLHNFPQGMPLPDRTTICLSKNPDFMLKGATIAHSMEELLELLEAYDSGEVCVLGGESIYKQLLSYCDTVHVTMIDHEYAADSYFENLDLSNEWEVTETSDEQTYFDLAYEFIEYRRRSLSHAE